MSIVTCQVSMDWADDAMRATAASYELKINDPRVLLAAHRLLLDQPTVTAADLVRAERGRYFVVAMGARNEPVQWNNPVKMAQGWLDGTFTAWTVLFNKTVGELQPLDLRLKLEVIG